MGTVTAEYRIANLLLASNPSLDPKTFIQEQIDMLMNVLPKGAKYLGYSQNNSPAMYCLEFVMAFEHPVFKDGSKIETYWSRQMYPKDDGSIGEATLFLGVHYLNPDGTTLVKP